MSGADWKIMFRSVQANDIELVKYYLKMGIDPNFQHPEYMALPLAESIRYNFLEITELLLQNGAKPLIREMETGVSTLETAKRLGNEKVLELLNKFIEK